MGHDLRRLLVPLATLVAVLACAGVAAAADIGANDDTGKWAPDGGVAFFEHMASFGLGQTVMTVRWQPSADTAISYVEHLDRAVAAATAAGLRVVLAVYPYPPREIESVHVQPSAFADYVRRIGERYPEVKQFVIGNEPNQPAFWRPQFSRRTGANVSAQTFGVYLAAAYDALKALDPGIRVIGVGLSPRGNDRARARNNISTSPMRFLGALGRWYRSSGRATPLMDGFSFHPYPNRATDPLDRGYVWPHAGFVNLDRIKQGLWDAFAGTAQPTTLDGLRLYLDEVGWQVDTTLQPGYEGFENVPVTTELAQAAIYGEIVRRAACDPDVAEVNFFGFYDDSLRTGFQAGLHRVGGVPRPSADAVRAAIAEGSASCVASTPWAPTLSVLGAERPKVLTKPTTVTVRARTDEGTKVLACVFPRSTSTPAALRALTARGSGALSCRQGHASPRRPARLTIRRLADVAQGGTIAVSVTAEANTARRSTYVMRFR